MAAKLSRRVVFGRVGWMKRYAGPTPGDERPIGGGSYNEKNLGSELPNFKKRGDRLYGYFETAMSARKGDDDTGPLKLERIDASAEEKDSLSEMLVVLVAKHPAGGQVIVGWYQNATLFKIARTRPSPDDDYSYRWTASAASSVLLPISKRTFVIPTGAGAMGQSNVCYPLEADGTSKRARWMQDAIDYVESYDGGNLLVSEVDEDEVAEVAEKELRRGQGRWVGADAKARKALEEYAVKKAMKFFASHGKVQNVGATQSYDVCCTPPNGKKLCVEVKATTTAGEQVALTAREVELAGERALFVVHSVNMDSGKPSGGVVRVIRPWNIEQERLKPITYVYRLPKA